MLKEEKTVSEIASETKIHPTQLNHWKRQAIEKLPQVFTDENKTVNAMKTDYEKQIEDLYAEVGRLTTQLNWLKKIRSLIGHAMNAWILSIGRTGSYRLRFRRNFLDLTEPACITSLYHLLPKRLLSNTGSMRFIRPIL